MSLKLLLPILGVVAVALAGPFSPARAATDISPEEARQIAEEAYVYGFPNWLPAPEGPFYLVMRLYGPEPSALEGDWTPPALRRQE